MKSATAPAKKPVIRLAVVESDPLRFVGFRALFDSESDFELVSAHKGVSQRYLQKVPFPTLVLLVKF